ncbi:MAG: GMP synthase [glutamine-hydrolyzing], amidotransferase subunit / GMP synthase [glutamine-hydrolyzing], ATP pyrophosphatase subunit [uncultured Rubrobacteraceae bacterium]|uniref:GMP synthase [glutamine-hydrolyzing] n=1 Tax=uncultured Rubrobacteraceae bacterium TaxID=349277 RepID=A0A6J4QHW7_9ACTN|nr:MAG: GMP synthase [glutamine-hydrolyzing], amidotransferase subunit / GMP synthase [glutamine-hydrolyzing], ATP pyrophosphatase subunit [uncultured Rubrobacteraceae bacterium]
MILVLDFGGQYSQLIARRVRECRVFSELIPYDTPVEEIRRRNPEGIILSGGPNSVYGEGAPRVDDGLFGLDAPMLGICYGMQHMALSLGGEVGAVQIREYGRSDLIVKDHEGLFAGTPDEQKAWTSHGDAVFAAPEGFRVTAETPSVPIIAFEEPGAGRFGVQFHPEVRHTEYGMEILKNFLFETCGCKPDWTPVNIITDAVERIREQVGDRKAICGLSGGVDSSTAAMLVHRAIGDNLTCVFVDHGLLRQNEAEQVIEAFGENSEVPLVHVDSKGRFLDKLAGVTDPEAKRKIIGEEFIRTFEEEAKGIEDATFLVQGTLYSDVIESGTRDAAKIKSHHNVGGLPEVMDLDLVEPLRNLFKDEVRVVAAELGMPERLVWRQPFPGPGLAIRVIGDVTGERLEILRRADAVLQEEIRAAGLYRDLWQSFAVLPAIHSVGVMGDARTYAYPVVIRAVTSDDAMTADWARLPYDLLEKISNRIINEVPGVNRVALDITSKPPGTIEWE